MRPKPRAWALGTLCVVSERARARNAPGTGQHPPYTHLEEPGTVSAALRGSGEGWASALELRPMNRSF